MATYKGCFPGTFQEPHHVTGPAPAPPPRLAASRGPTHREPPPLVTPGQAVASNLLPSPPGPRGPNPSAQQRGGRRAANQMFASDVTNRGRHGRRERELSSGTLDGGDLLQFEASEMMLNCTASSETGAFLGQSEEGLASKVCQFHWSFQPPVVPRVKITSNVLMNKKLSQLSVFGRIRIPASSMIPRRKKGCSE
ncbi:uncharacterized protein LOC133211129 isoform X4 [Neopsephotus bourkii]|uniref:uncharacterized protein LOC133211129 isoform X4 n=1 Tax=Neopsephotus bourkii TaxID=309878 RepID=UPI002AA5B6DB|nr:uncharacterized protein LOC133211129 isoform X4 [Neopsephotus bourkii]